MLEPGVGAVAAVLAELDPLLAETAKNAVRFYLCDERVGTESGRALLGVAAAGLVGGGVVCGVEVVEGGFCDGGLGGRWRAGGWIWFGFGLGHWRRGRARDLAGGAVLEPGLYGKEMVVGVEREPGVAEIAEDTLGVEFADIGVFGE